MRPIRITQTGTGDTVPVPLDYRNIPDVSLQVQVVGTATWTVQQTLDDVFDTAITPVWFDHPDTNMVAQTVNRQGNFDKPVRATRLSQTAGAGSCIFTVIQSEVRP